MSTLTSMLITSRDEPLAMAKALVTTFAFHFDSIFFADVGSYVVQTTADTKTFSLHEPEKD